MSARDLLETPTEQHRGDETIAVGRWPVDRPFPALLTDVDLMAVFDISKATFYAWKREGKFARFETTPQLSKRHTRYSGALVQRYVLAQWTEARTFGAKRGPRPVQPIPVTFRPSNDAMPQPAPTGSQSALQASEFGFGRGR